jgi:hypothetical protein
MPARKLLLILTLFCLFATIMQAQTASPAQEVILFTINDFVTLRAGDYAKVKAGKYDALPSPITDKRIVSIKVPPGMKVTLYDRKNCLGEPFEVYSDIKDLRVLNLFGKIGSLKVENTPKNISQQFISLNNINEAFCPTSVTRGDREFDGHGPRMKCDVKLRITDEGKSITADITFSAQETQHDWSTTEGKWSKKVYDVVDSKKRIVNIDYDDYAVVEFVGNAAGAQGEIGSARPISGHEEFWKEMEKKYGINLAVYRSKMSQNYVKGLGGGYGNNSVYILPPMKGRVVSKFHLAGDTGGPDISNDRSNCQDDTRIEKIEFNRIYVQIEQR